MEYHLMKYFTTALIAIFLCSGCTSKKEPAVTWPRGEWKRHTIDDSSQGADGTRFADINGDGLLDITTPWEQGGEIRVYIQPAKTEIRKPWPKSKPHFDNVDKNDEMGKKVESHSSFLPLLTD